jgi:RNase P/RNase MRP subunit POP5
MRIRLRFYVLELEGQPHLPPSPVSSSSAADVRAALATALVEGFGDTTLGLAEASRVLAVRACGTGGAAFVVRAPAGVDRQLRAALALVRAVRGRPAALRLRRVCGSLRTLRHAAAGLGLAAADAPDAFGAPADALGAAVAAATAAAQRHAAAAEAAAR